MSQLASIDFFTVHTIWFEVLFVFVVLAHDPRVLHFSVTAHPTAATQKTPIGTIEQKSFGIWSSLQHGRSMTECNDFGLQFGLVAKASEQAPEDH